MAITASPSPSSNPASPVGADEPAIAQPVFPLDAASVAVPPGGVAPAPVVPPVLVEPPFVVPTGVAVSGVVALPFVVPRDTPKEAGGWQTFAAMVVMTAAPPLEVDVPEFPASVLPLGGVLETEVLGPGTHVHVAGQSASTTHVVALGVQNPGNDVVVVHVVFDDPASATITGVVVALPSLDVEPLAPALPALPVLPGVAVPVPELPEQDPLTVGLQVKLVPQSESVLQGSCHL